MIFKYVFAHMRSDIYKPKYSLNLINPFVLVVVVMEISLLMFEFPQLH